MLTVAKMQCIIASVEGGIDMSWQEKVENLMLEASIKSSYHN